MWDTEMQNLFLIGVILLKIIVIVLILLLTVAYLTFFERRIIGFIQAPIGPNRVWSLRLVKPISDVIKLLNKEIIIPTASNRYLFVVAPVITLGTSLAAWAVIPFDSVNVLANINAGVLFV